MVKPMPSMYKVLGLILSITTTPKKISCQGTLSSHHYSLQITFYLTSNDPYSDNP
jgi:hypothetical protein